MLKRLNILRCASATGTSSTSGGSRFVSPWAETGLDASGIHTSSNPILRQRRDESRMKEFQQQQEEQIAQQEHISRDKEIFVESQRKMREQTFDAISNHAENQEEVKKKKPKFTKFGATTTSSMSPQHEHRDLLQHHQQEQNKTKHSQQQQSSSSPFVANIDNGEFHHIEEYRRQAGIIGDSTATTAASSSTSSYIQADLDHVLELPEINNFKKNLNKEEKHQEFPFGGKVGFALDVDGVLIRGSPSVGVQTVQGTFESMEFLKKAKIPFVLLTNGGGGLEKDMAKRISQHFKKGSSSSSSSSETTTTTTGNKKEQEQKEQEQQQDHEEEEDFITERHVIVAHTPMKALANNPEFSEKPVLVVGPLSAVDVLKSYGFKQPMHVKDFQQTYPHFVPLKSWETKEQKERVKNSLKRVGEEMKQQQQQNNSNSNSKSSTKYPQFSAILVLSAIGIDAFNDFQIMLDVLLGVPDGTPGGSEMATEQTIPVFFAAEDLFWAAAPKTPRLGFGAIKEMFSSVFESVTGQPLETISYGKPRRIAYLCAEEMLRQQNIKLGWGDKVPELICMVGDNLETDIMGANAMNARGGGSSSSGSGNGHSSSSSSTSWLSVHVMTGVGRCPPAVRTITSSDVELQWLAQHFSDPVPHYVAPTFRHFLGELTHFSQDQITQMQTFRHVLPNPVEVDVLYNWKNNNNNDNKK